MCTLEQSEALKEQIRNALLNAGDAAVIRVKEPAPSTNALAWLEAQPFSAKCYVAKPDGSAEMASAGMADKIVADEFSKARSKAQPIIDGHPDNIKYFGGVSFYQSPPSDEWLAFGTSFFFLPRFEYHREGNGSCTLIVNVVVGKGSEQTAAIDAAIEDVSRLTFDVSDSEKACTPFPAARTGDCPNIESWQSGVNCILDHIADGRLEKAVFARRTRLKIQQPLSATQLLRALRRHSPDCFHFLLQIEPGTAFIGATPEMLFYRRRRLISSQAIAATRPRSEDPDEDARLALELLESEKEQHEHEVVARTIQDRLRPICSHLQLDGPVRVLKLSRVQHLSQSVAGVLKDDVDDARILADLHPTPAVGGCPRDAAIELLQDLEPFNRGWYAAPLGWFGKHSAGFAVGIRSALLHKDHIDLYAGAGIVEGSDAASEWAELESKISNFLNCFKEG